MNKKQEMWKKALEKIDEAYITEAAEYAPDRTDEEESAVQADLRGSVKRGRGGNILFVVAAAAAVIGCTIGAGILLDGKGAEITVAPSATATTETIVEPDIIKPIETDATDSGVEPVITTENLLTEPVEPFKIENGVLHISEAVTEIDAYLFSGYTDITEVIIPETVIQIGDYAFADSGLKTVVIEGAANIGEYAFVNCVWLERVTITGDIKRIGDYAFAESGVKRVTLPSTLEYIGKAAFSGCSSLKEVIIPDSVTYIGEQAFISCTSLEEITIPQGVAEIRSHTFFNCTSLKKVEIPDTVKNIGDNAFCGTALTSVELPSGLTSLGAAAFAGSELISVAIPSGVERISEELFFNCKKLTEVIIPDGVTEIGATAFFNCTSLTSVEIPDSVKSIGIRAFDNCVSLSEVIVPDSVTGIYDGAFIHCENISVIHKGETYTSENSSELYMYKPRLTFDHVRELAKKGTALSWVDFEPFEGEDIGSGLYIMYYPINDKYAVVLNGTPDEMPLQIRLTANYGEENREFVDLRESGAAEFIDKAEADMHLLIYPVDKPEAITTCFGYSEWRGGSHSGIDYGWDGSLGANIYAAASGTVKTVFKDYAPGYGLGMYVIINHGNGFETLYAHCSDIYVTEGQFVNQGDVIAAIGSTGWATGPHLHFEVTVDGESVDPYLYLKY